MGRSREVICIAYKEEDKQEAKVRGEEEEEQEWKSAKPRNGDRRRG